MTKFSIIVPIYKVEPYLQQCIESILQQSYDGFELILVDDGSPDNCGKICDDYALRDTRIQVIHKLNGGLVSARKAGIIQATGEYILYVDGDDYIGSNLLLRMNEIIDSHNPDMIAFGFTKVQENGQPIATMLNDLQTEKLYFVDEKNFCDILVYNPRKAVLNFGSIIHSIWTKVFKRDVLMECMLSIPEEICNGEDTAVVFSTLCKCNAVYISEMHEYYYRQIATSMTHVFKRDALRRQRILFNYMFQNMSNVLQENIDRYACSQILLRINQAANGLECYKEYLFFLREEMTPDIYEIINRLRIPSLCLKHCLLFCLLKLHAFGLLWIVYRRKKLLSRIKR